MILVKPGHNLEEEQLELDFERSGDGEIVKVEVTDEAERHRQFVESVRRKAANDGNGEINSDETDLGLSRKELAKKHRSRVDGILGETRKTTRQEKPKNRELLTQCAGFIQRIKSTTFKKRVIREILLAPAGTRVAVQESSFGPNSRILSVRLEEKVTKKVLKTLKNPNS